MKRTTAIVLLLLTVFMGGRTARACTVFAVRDGAGHYCTINQEDWGEYWASLKPAQAAMLSIPAGKNQLARVLFSWDGVTIEGGMNEKGLVWDFVALRGPDNLLPESGKLKYPGPLGEKVLAECATVADAINLYKTHEETILGYGAAIISDASGAAVVVFFDRASGGVAFADRESGLARSSGTGTVIYTNPEVFGLGVKYEAVYKMDAADPDLEKMAAITTRDVTVYTCIYDQTAQTLRLYYNHDMSRYAEIVVSASSITKPSFTWVSSLMPGANEGARLPLQIFSSYPALEKALFIILAVVGFSFLLQAFFKGRHRIGPAAWASYWIFITVLAFNLAVQLFYGRVIRFYGFGVVSPAAPALPWALAAAALAMAAAVVFTSTPGPRRALVVTHGLLPAAAALGGVVFILLSGPVW